MKLTARYFVLSDGLKVPTVELSRGDQIFRLNLVTDEACDKLVDALTGLTCNVSDITDYRMEDYYEK